MGRHKCSNTDSILSSILAGLSNKEIAITFGVGNTLPCHIAARYGLKRQYVTDAEFKQILGQRKRLRESAA